MNEVTLPPSPNWYLSRILACASDGTIAWGARNAIVIARPGGEDKILKYSIIANAHTDRVTSLAFSPKFGKEKKNLLVSGGDEHVIKIWNLDYNSVVMAHSYRDVKQKVIGVDWSNSDPDLVYCVSSEGSLISWNIAYNVAQPICLEKLTATCISCCPHDTNLVAIGTKSGLIFIVDTKGSGTVAYKLRGHDVEIASLSWCPVDINVLSGNGARDLLLASGGKDRSIFIWKAGGDGRYQTKIMLPRIPLDSNQHGSKLGISAGGWTALCWVAPKLLLASSSWNELISWDLSFVSKKKHPCKLIHACHSRGLFCIASVPREQTADYENWGSENQSDITVWTLAQDRQVVCCRITELEPKIEYNIPTQGGSVYCMAACPLDTSRIAFGVGDTMIRLWNLCKPHKSTFDIATLRQKIKGKVRAISWHPEKENWLAFSTGKGRVGVFDTNVNKPPILYKPYHRHNIYSIGWGPSPKNTTKVLYSCGDGELVYYDPEKPCQDPEPVIKKECTEFAWKPNFTCMALGFKDGSISFVTSNLSECGRPIHTLKKAVQCLAWHPESTATDLSLSPLRNYLAVSIDASTITIFDMSGLLNSLGQSKNADGSKESTSNDVNTTADEPPLHRVVARLSGHAGKIVSLAWSPHISGYLVSGSYDNTAKVWKVETEESVGTYTAHCGPVHCCMWSPLDRNLIITGSADFTIRVWKLGDVSNAAKHLSRWNDLESVKIAGELALAVKDEELCESLANLAIMQMLLNSDCASVESLIAQFPLIKYREVHMRAFEAICKVLRNDETTNRTMDWISGNSQFGLLCDLKERYPNCHSHYAKLARDVCTTIPESNASLWLNVSHQIALAISTDDNEKYLSHIVTALNMICLFEMLHSQEDGDYSKDSLTKILCNLEARAPTAENSLFADERCTITKSLRAYLCLGLLNWLGERNSEEIEEEEIVEPVLKLVEELLKDLLDRNTVIYCSTANEVNKLEAFLMTALVQLQRIDETGDARIVMTYLMERLDRVRCERKYFVKKRVCAPSPILAYGKAIGVASMLKKKHGSTFMSVLSETWRKAVS